MKRKRLWRKINILNHADRLIRRLCFVILVAEIAFGVQKWTTMPAYEVQEIIRINNE